MGWINLVFLGVGVLIGLLIGQTFLKSPRGARSQTIQQLEQQNRLIQEQLHRTQLAYQMAVETSQFKSGFLARTSHELRSPINSVISLHQLILADLCDSHEEEREYIAQSSIAAQRMLGLLDQLITVSKTQQGSIELQIQPVHLASLLKQVYELTYLQAQNRNLQLEIEEADPDIYVLADPGRLQQVLVNLIDTAIAQMQEGWIRLSTDTEPQDGYAHLLLRDQRPANAWSEAIDLLRKTAYEPENSPFESVPIHAGTALPSGFDPHNTRYPLPSGLTLFANQTLMEEMNGRLQLWSIPSAATNLSSIRCSIPLVEPDADDLR